MMLYHAFITVIKIAVAIAVIMRLVEVFIDLK